jgi:hypothetical protein
MQGPIMLARDLAEASAGASREIAAGLRARLVRAADELARAPLDAKRGAVAIDHPHVRPIAVEANELVGAVAEKCMIITRHADIRLQPRKAASSARETFRNGRQLESPDQSPSALASGAVASPSTPAPLARPRQLAHPLAEAHTNMEFATPAARFFDVKLGPSAAAGSVVSRPAFSAVRHAPFAAPASAQALLSPSPQ